MDIVLISTYEQGRQPFGLGSPAAWLRSGGHRVRCLDLSVESLDEEAVRAARLVAIHLPMHTATRLALQPIRKIALINPRAHLCCVGLYAPLNEAFLREAGVKTILGGEFEPALLRLADALSEGRVPQQEALVQLDRLKFQVPDRSTLPAPASYARLHLGDTTRVAGYTEASRGCKHLCRHCPVVPIYQGAFRVVQAGIVLADIRQQVAAGVEHISFGDPDFWNGPTHAMRIVEALHREWPGLTYDATIKIEHLRRHRDLIPRLRDTGCVFVTSAVESLDDEVLAKLDKGHTRADFLQVVAWFRKAGLALSPTFIAFTPWTTLDSYRQLLAAIAELDLIENVGSVQLALRLLIPAGSRLLELPGIRDVVTGFDPPALLHRWSHVDPEVDRLAASVLQLVTKQETRRELFRQVWNCANGVAGMFEPFDLVPRTVIPYMDEPWYC